MERVLEGPIGECGAAPTETGAVPTAPAPGCSCGHLEEGWPLLRMFSGDVLIVCWDGGRGRHKLS